MLRCGGNALVVRMLRCGGNALVVRSLGTVVMPLKGANYA